MTDWPMRDITDPRVLRAMAHPIRLQLLNSLVIAGPGTATELAERIGDTAANCSWHLRQLAKFGFIEEAEGGVGRNRPWRYVPTGHRWSETGAAASEVTNALLGFELAEHHAWEERKPAESQEWQQAAYTVQSVAFLTADELKELNDTITALLIRHPERFTNPETRPDGARAIRLVAWGIPTK